MIHHDGSVEWISSDSTTKCWRNLSEKSDVPTKGGLGFLQECDSRLLTKNWNELIFDDSKWEKNKAIHYRSVDPSIDWSQRFKENKNLKLEPEYRLIISQ